MPPGWGETFRGQDEQPWEPEPLKHTADVTGSLERGRRRDWQEKPLLVGVSLVVHCLCSPGRGGQCFITTFCALPQNIPSCCGMEC